jgi:hypothetical protein
MSKHHETHGTDAIHGEVEPPLQSLDFSKKLGNVRTLWFAIKPKPEKIDTRLNRLWRVGAARAFDVGKDLGGLARKATLDLRRVGSGVVESFKFDSAVDHNRHVQRLKRTCKKRTTLGVNGKNEPRCVRTRHKKLRAERSEARIVVNAIGRARANQEKRTQDRVARISARREQFNPTHRNLFGVGAIAKIKPGLRKRKANTRGTNRVARVILANARSCRPQHLREKRTIPPLRKCGFEPAQDLLQERRTGLRTLKRLARNERSAGCDNRGNDKRCRNKRSRTRDHSVPVRHAHKLPCRTFRSCAHRTPIEYRA